MLLPGGVKENLILKSPAAQNIFEIEYAVSGLNAIEKDSRTIHLTDSDGNIKYIIAAPYMEDAQGAASPELQLEITAQTAQTLSIPADGG